MWVEIACGFVVYKLFRRFLLGDDAPLEEVDTGDSDVFFAVATRMERLYGGKAYVGLRIPDADSGTRQSIDVVLVTKAEMILVAVRNFSGFVDVDNHGNWIDVLSGGKRHKVEAYADPVSETTRQTAILESYLEQRGVTLPKGYLSGKVVLPNPNSRASHSITFMSEVITFDKWTVLKPEPRSGLSTWIKDAFRGGKNETLDGIYQKLQFIISTAPMWDRLELKGDRNVLGEFMEFKGKQEDMQALKNIKRTKVSRFMTQKSFLFGSLGRSKIQLLYVPRDYRREGTSVSEWKEITVKSGTEVIFQAVHSKKTLKIKLSNIVSLSLSA